MADMTAVDPTGIDAAGKVALYWVPAIANPAAPKLTELQAGINISNIAYEWDQNSTQDKQERWRYGYATGGTTLGATKYDPPDLVYDYSPQDVEEATGEYKHYGQLVPGLSGFHIDRRGLSPDVPLAVDQIIDVMPAKLGTRHRMKVDPQQAGEKLRVRQGISVTGVVLQDVKIVT